MARPSKFTSAVTDTIIAAVRLGATYEHAAACAGVSYETMRRWLRAGEREPHGEFCGFCVAFKEAEAAYQLELLLVLRHAAVKDWRAAAWVLERRWPAQWGRWRIYCRTNPDEPPVPVAAPAPAPVKDAFDWEGYVAATAALFGPSDAPVPALAAPAQESRTPEQDAASSQPRATLAARTPPQGSGLSPHAPSPAPRR